MESQQPVANWLRIPLSVGQVATFGAYARALQEENLRQNLTSLRDRASIEQRHFGESLALLQALEELGVQMSPAIDIGSGAGIPGLPIAIARPEVDVTLLEATGKKAGFLERMARELGLANVLVLNARAEDAARDPAHRGLYALALARAVAPLRVLLELAVPFLVTGGVLAAPKGSGARGEVQEAAAALEELHAEVEETRPLVNGAPGPSPTLVVVRKVGETPERYPRRPGIPSKRPL
jgi:16S rRNA (guanine527-N7)-methyltransferase